MEDLNPGSLSGRKNNETLMKNDRELKPVIELWLIFVLSAVYDRNEKRSSFSDADECTNAYLYRCIFFPPRMFGNSKVTNKQIKLYSTAWKWTPVEPCKPEHTMGESRWGARRDGDAKQSCRQNVSLGDKRLSYLFRHRRHVFLTFP